MVTMNDSLLLFSAFLLLSTLLSSISQAMLKKAAMRDYKNLYAEYLNPLVVGAYSIFLGCTLLTLYSYKVVPLGLGAVLEATGYIYITIIGVLVFKEKLTVSKVCALGFIVLGVLIYSVAM